MKKNELLIIILKSGYEISHELWIIDNLMIKTFFIFFFFYNIKFAQKRCCLCHYYIINQAKLYIYDIYIFCTILIKNC